MAVDLHPIFSNMRAYTYSFSAAVITPLLPENAMCWNLVFQYLQTFAGRVLQVIFPAWIIYSLVTPDLKAETVAGTLAVAALAVWAICYLGKSYTETPAAKKERLAKEKMKADEEAR